MAEDTFFSFEARVKAFIAFLEGDKEALMGEEDLNAAYRVWRRFMRFKTLLRGSLDLLRDLRALLTDTLHELEAEREKNERLREDLRYYCPQCPDYEENT